MDKEDAVAATALLLSRGVGPAKLTGFIEKSVACGQTLAEYVQRPEVRTESITDRWQEAESSVGKAFELGFRCLSVRDEQYPRRLLSRLGRRSPPVLFWKGSLDLLAGQGVGFCGSRNASEKGLTTAAICTREIASHGFAVVSGYAKGVDTTVHREALMCGGSTIVVLPEGVLNFRVKKDLDEHWDSSKTLVLSEFAPGAPWSVHRAMARNTTICSLSNAMILIEARNKGGSYEAGQECLRLGVDLYAIWYREQTKQNIGNTELIKQGAHPLGTTEDGDKPHIRKVIDGIRESTPLLDIADSEQLDLFSSG